MKNIIALIVAAIGAVLFILWISSNLFLTSFFAFIIYLISKFILEGISVFAISRYANKSRVRKIKFNLKHIGKYLIHFGFTLMLMGMLGVEHGSQQVPISLSVGEHETIEGMTITNISIQQFREEEPRMIYENGFDLSLGDKKPVRLYPRIEVYERIGLRISIPAIYTSPWKDVQLVLQDWGGVNMKNSIEVLLFPLALWIWIGSGLMILGTGFLIIEVKPINTTIIQLRMDIFSHFSIK
jgi:cytochrome c biogenesis factor